MICGLALVLDFECACFVGLVFIWELGLGDLLRGWYNTIILSFASICWVFVGCVCFVVLVGLVDGRCWCSGFVILDVIFCLGIIVYCLLCVWVGWVTSLPFGFVIGLVLAGVFFWIWLIGCLIHLGLFGG